MQYLDDSSGDTLVVGEPEPCADCGRPMLRWDFGPVRGCTERESAMCWGPKVA